LRATPSPAGLAAFFEALMRADAGRIARAVEQASASARDRKGEPTSRWLLELGERHPGDAGALAPLLLHVVTLLPGQALYLGARGLHSYLEGTGIEIMANSDNVLRGGLTSKHVDVPELLRTLIFESARPEVLTPQPIGAGEARYVTPAAEFELGVITLRAGARWESARDRGPEIVLVVEGSLDLVDRSNGQRLSLARGESALVSAAVERYAMTGAAVAYRAAVPR
jgi:mannose-6-phosphate isomerase